MWVDVFFTEVIISGEKEKVDMIPAQKNYVADPSIPIEKVARLIQTFSRQEKAKLLQLVPELQTIRPEEAEFPGEQADLMAYFQTKMGAPQSSGGAPDIFLNNLTMAEFFALSEAEQDHLWQEAHVATERTMNHFEQPVRPDAIPAR
ncbi:MAG: hypothetical protein U0401_19510 [Anaerolineae bacterium]